MAVGLEYISLIVPIDKIEQYYPGGFEKYKSDHKQSIGGSIWYDDYLVRDGAMNNYDVGRLSGEYAARILNGEKPGDIPVGKPARLRLVINPKAAAKMGVQIPPEVTAKAADIVGQ